MGAATVKSGWQHFEVTVLGSFLELVLLAYERETRWRLEKAELSVPIRE